MLIDKRGRTVGNVDTVAVEGKKNGGVDHAYRRVMFKNLLEKCKRTKVCFQCEARTGGETSRTEFKDYSRKVYEQ